MARAWVLMVGVWLMLGAAATVNAAEDGKKLQLTSPAFRDKEPIPDMYTCHGSNINPELDIANIPAKTKSLALVVDDPDAPEGIWVHWLLYDITPKTQKIGQNSTVGSEGLTDFGIFHYRGPCPDNKRVHRYSFRIYALSERVELNEGFIKSDLERKMKGKILGQAELIGTYKNPDTYND
jgi:Raf kinase inhibitor-like YbhB/YbcL family protein